MAYKTADIKKLIEKRVRFKYLNRTHNPDGWLYGKVEEVFRGQVYIGGDWYTISQILVIKELIID